MGEASRYSKYPSFVHNGPLVAHTEHPNTPFLLLSGKSTRVIDHRIDRKRFGERNFKGETDEIGMSSSGGNCQNCLIHPFSILYKSPGCYTRSYQNFQGNDKDARCSGYTFRSHAIYSSCRRLL